MLAFRDVSIFRGGRALVRGVTMGIHAGQKVGVTGANGAGKSSLFALVRGELQPDAGVFGMPPGLVIAHVAQETPPDPRPAIEYVLDGDTELRRVQAAIAAAEGAHAGMALGELHARLDAIGGYVARARAARLLNGLGFTTVEESAPVETFSGGWRMRLNLARALMCRSDLLLLDEPTNHLDLDAVIWLEGWLRSYPGTLLLISHDRDFLDRVVEAVAHIEHGGIRLYSGNYSAFERRRAEQLAVQQAAFQKQQREVAHMRAFVDRFRYKASKARQAQSRLKALSRMELIAPAHVDSPFSFRFRAPFKLPTPLLALDEVSAGYPGRRVLEGVKLTLMPGERIGLLGANGAGKSTFIKLLAGELSEMGGRVQPARDLAVGYFAQHQVEQLDGRASPMLHLQRLDPPARAQELRAFLGSFNFSGDMAQAPVATFSGGEKARLVLALVLYQRPNLLLLDEPTNHLDLEMRHALSVALQDFEGAMVLVSHDRHLLRLTSDRLLLVHDGAVQPWPGDLDDYARWLAGGRRELPVADTAEDEGQDATTPPPRRADRRVQQRQAAARARERLRPLREEVRRQESVLERLQRRHAELEARLAEPGLYDDGRKDELKGLLIDRARLDHQLAEAEAAWLQSSEVLEDAERAAAGA